MDTDLLADIKFNCDVSDAKFWGFYSVCGLLMRYRDLFRSEQGLKPWADIRREDIAAWIERKEVRWPELEQKDLRPLVVDDHSFDPFDVEGINRAIDGRGLVYGAGYGMYMKPSFFLAERRAVRLISGLTVYTSGKELVRDLFTAPAMLQEKTVFLRLEPLVLLLLYKHSELNTRQVSALEDAFSHYGIPRRQIIDATFELRIAEMAERFAEILLSHELAEDAERCSRIAEDRSADLNRACAGKQELDGIAAGLDPADADLRHLQRLLRHDPHGGRGMEVVPVGDIPMVVRVGAAVQTAPLQRRQQQEERRR